MLTHMNVIGILYIYEFGTIKIRWYFFFNEKGKQWNRWKDKIIFKLSLNPSNFNADVLSLRYQSWSAFFSNIRNIPTPTAVPLESYTNDIISKAMWGARLQLFHFWAFIIATFVDYFDYLFIFFFFLHSRWQLSAILKIFNVLVFIIFATNQLLIPIELTN